MKHLFSIKHALLAASILLSAIILIITSCSKSSTTIVNLATVSTENASSILPTGATLGGNISNDGGAQITERGICFNTTTGPTISNTKVISGSGTGSFTADITGLAENTTYFARAYAINSKGTSYGQEIKFATDFETISIGTQIWMKNNLNTSTYRNGDLIPQIADTTGWEGLLSGAWCYYNNDSSNAGVYGKLYNWYAVNDSRNIAPVGWHVATDADWSALTTFLGGEPSAGGAIKETGTAHWNSPNTGATNSAGFTGLPGGYRGFQGAGNFIGSRGYFWTSTPALLGNVWYRILYNDDSKVLRDNYSGEAGMSIRCIKD